MNAVLLVHSNPSFETVLVTDASNIAVGAVVQQFNPTVSTWEPLGFFSHHLCKAELKYSVFDKELLGVYLGIRHFHFYLEGQLFEIWTDHKPLCPAFKNTSEPWSPCQQRHLSYISEFSSDIVHIPSAENVVSDSLSHAVIGNISESKSSLDFVQLGADQDINKEMVVSRMAMTNLKLLDVMLPNVSRPLLCDVSTGHPRPLVPTSWRRKILDIAHCLSHPLKRSTLSLIRKDFTWHGMSKDVVKWCRECLPCQWNKVGHHTINPIQPFTIPCTRFSHVHVDLVGPLTLSQGCHYLLTIIDRTTRWPEAIPLPDSTAETCTAAFIHGWVAHFGTPAHITFDCGIQFTSKLWQEIVTTIGSKLHFCTSYHPQANGMVECMHRTLKQALKARLTGPDWFSQLPWVMLGLGSTPKEDINALTAELVYGALLRLPGVCLANENDSRTDVLARSHAVAQFLPSQMPQCNSKIVPYVPKSLNVTPFIFIHDDKVRPPLSYPYLGPFKVLNKNDSAYQIDTGLGGMDWVSISHLKLAFVPEDFEQTAMLCSQGCPH